MRGRDSGLPDPQQSVLAECGQQVLVRVMRQSYHILLVDLNMSTVELGLDVPNLYSH